MYYYFWHLCAYSLYWKHKVVCKLRISCVFFQIHYTPLCPLIHSHFLLYVSQVLGNYT